MIDLHSHVLPGIDDGASDMEQALSMCRSAVENGITHMVATPHIQPGCYDNTKASIERVCLTLKHELKVNNIPLELASAAEVHFDDKIITMHAKESLPFLGRWEGEDVLLLEFPHTHVPFAADKLITWLLARGVRPLLAHPERNKDMNHNASLIHRYIEMGCLMQVTAAALEGRFGARCLSCAEYMLQRNLITILATDTHNATRRPPNLKSAKCIVDKIVGAGVGDRLVYDNPWKIAESLFCR